VGEFPNRSTQFKKGNPGSAGRGTYRQRAEKVLDRKATDRSVTAIINALLAKAEDGDLAAAKLVLERVLPATQHLEVERVDASSFLELEAALARIQATADAAEGDGEPLPKRSNGAGGGLQ
jgi:hypothetical protein